MRELETFEIRFQEAKTQDEKVSVMKEFLKDKELPDELKASFLTWFVDMTGFYKKIKTFKPVFPEF